MTTYLPTPEYGTTYGLLEGGIIRSSEKKHKTSSRTKKGVSFSLLDHERDIEGVEVTRERSCYSLDRGGESCGGEEDGTGDDTCGNNCNVNTVEGGGGEEDEEGRKKMSAEMKQPGKMFMT